MARGRFARWRRRVPRAVGVVAAALSLTVAAGCSALGLSDETPPDASIVTTAASIADPSSTEHVVVTVPTLDTANPSSRPAPTPWESLTSSSAPPTTSEAPLTAPTTTRTTLTFETLPSVTAPTIAAPTLDATPPPECYLKGTCKPVGSTTVGNATLVVVNPPGGASTVVILSVGGTQADALGLAHLASPSISCAGAHCLVQGASSGVYFGSLVAIKGQRLAAVSGSPTSASALRLSGSGSSLLVAGMQRFGDYGLPVTDAPVGARTWTLSGGKLVSTGCGAPRLYSAPPAATSAQSGPCSGTPQIAGYGAASANKITHLGGFATPSGNIACAVISGSQLACTAKSHDFAVATCSKPVQEVPAALRGLRVVVGKTGAVTSDGCLGYTLVGSPTPAIAYGRLAAGAGFVCEVQQTGVSCTAPSGHGFTLSRAALTKK